VQGKHPDEPKEGDNSRSAFLYDAVCNLLRAGVPDEVIYSVITDPEFGISASVLDKQNVHKYAVKQIEVARTDASPLQGWLSVANEKYAFIKTVGGGKPRVMWTTVTGVRQFQGKDDFRFSLIGESVSIGEKDGKPIVKPLADAWLTSPGRHTYETLAFAPGKTMPDNVFNTWEGWTIDPPPEGANCERFLELTRDVICSGNPVHYAWMLNWMAHRVQRLFEPPQIAVVLRGGGGVGKSFWVKHLGQLFGKKYFAHLSDPDHFLGNFNASLSEKLLVFGDEIFVTRDKKMQSQLKRLVTEETMQVERKGIDTVEEDRYFALMLATNEGWAVPAGVDERRLMVLDVSGCHKEDKAFFKAVQHEWTHGGKEALFALLGKHDISEFEYRERPVTRALVDQMTRSFTGAQRYVYNMLCSGEAPIRAFRDGVADYDLGFTRVEAFVETTPMAEKAKVSGTSMGCALAAICVGGKAGARPTVDGQQRRGAWLLPLHEARSAFAMAMKHELEWPDVDGGWVSSLTLGPEAALAASRQAGTADLPF
jgi:hypothetical protein